MKPNSLLADQTASELPVSNQLKLSSLVFLLSITASSASCAKDEDTAANTVDISNAEVEQTMDDTIAHGEQAHKNHCYKCHTDEIYTREDRFVKSIDALSKQVVRCKDSTDAPWFDEDAEAVVQFLNKKYYRF